MALLIKDKKVYLSLNSTEWLINYTYHPIEHERDVIAVGETIPSHNKFASYFIDEEYKLFKVEVNRSGEITKKGLLPDQLIVDYSENLGNIASAITKDGDLLVCEYDEDDEPDHFINIPLGVKFSRTLVGDLMNVMALDKNGNLWGNDYCLNTFFGQKSGGRNLFNFSQMTNNLKIRSFDLEVLSLNNGYLVTVSTNGKIYFFTNPIDYIKEFIGIATQINLGNILPNKCLIHIGTLYILDLSQNLFSLNFADSSGNLHLTLIEQQVKSISHARVHPSDDGILILQKDGKIKEIGKKYIVPQSFNYNTYVFEDDNLEEARRRDNTSYVRDQEIYENFTVDLLPGDYLGNTDLNKRFGHTKRAI